MTDLFRSVLYLPGSNSRAVTKARSLNCDVVVLDLEDAVAPELKAQARQAALEAVRAGGFGPKVAVRINPPDTDLGREDLAALAESGVDIVVVPKIELATDIEALTGRLPVNVSLWAMIETPRALLNLQAIAQAGGPLSALMLGTNDLIAALGCQPTPDREAMKTWLAATVATGRAHGLTVIDGVFNALEDSDGLHAECAQGRRYGFDGKSLIHPNQIAAANAAFSPTPDEVARAHRIVAAFADPSSTGLGAIRTSDGMVERLHQTAAVALLQRHEACSRQGL